MAAAAAGAKDTSIVTMTPTTKDEEPEIKKLEMVGINHHKHKAGEVVNHHKTPEELEEETDAKLPLSKLGWSPIRQTPMVFLEEGERAGIGLLLGEEANIFELIDHITRPNEEIRLYYVLETLNEYNEPLKKKCFCCEQNQKDHNFDCTVLAWDQGEVMNISKTSPTEVFMTKGKERIGMIVQEDGFGDKEYPTQYTINDSVGPVLTATKDQMEFIYWHIRTYSTAPVVVAEIGQKWSDVPGGSEGLQGKRFAIKFDDAIDPALKGYLIGFMMTIYFRFSHFCNITE